MKLKMNRDQILITERLCKNYSNFTALNDLNLSVSANTCLGFLGPNGAGKSTTIKILTGLIKPSSGRAIISGFDVTKDFKHALSRVGLVVETPEFYPQLSPFEILDYFGSLRGISKNNIKTRSKEVLEMVKMTDWAKKKIGQFSKGMRQRIALAASLLHDPDLIILDEPTSGLDPRGIIEVRELIKSLKKEGKTIFMSSHLLHETQEICDQVALIDQGKLLHYGPVNLEDNSLVNSKIFIELIEQPTNHQIDEISQLKSVHEISCESPSNLFVEFQGGLEDRANLLKFLQETGLRVVTFRTLDSQLEKLYMHIISESKE